MKKVVMIKKAKNDCLRVTPLHVEGLSGFEQLYQFLDSNYKVKILDQIEGPDVRKWF